MADDIGARALGGSRPVGAGSASPRLSPDAAVVLNIAHELARRDRTVEPDSGHVLIALLRVGGSVVADAFGMVGLSYEAALGALDALRNDPGDADELPGLLREANAAAVRDGQLVTTPPHLLIGSVRTDATLAARALASLSVSGDAVRRAVAAPRDMLVPLLSLPNPTPALHRAHASGISIRRARAWEEPPLRAFIAAERFAATWGPEAAAAFARVPRSVFVATRAEVIVGFAAYDCAARGVFGPTGVARAERGSGVAAALLLQTLVDMRSAAYIYAVIGAVGPAEFYERTANAVLLTGAWPSYVTSDA